MTTRELEITMTTKKVSREIDLYMSRVMLGRICGDPEIDHANTDEFIQEILKIVGMEETAKTYKQLCDTHFWYA